MSMIYLKTNSLDPTWNLAFEEFCFKELRRFPKIFLLWQNDNAIIIGRYQNVESEINVDAAKQNGAKVVRRATGGGTVYHDLGNLNYSFIMPAARPEDIDFSVIAKPMVDALRSLGVPAVLHGRNDIVVDDKKISGTAHSFSQGRVLHHGTLLYDSSLDTLQKMLNVETTKFISKGLSSVRSRVTNIKNFMPVGYSIDDFRQDLLNYFAKTCGIQDYELTDNDLAKVKRIQREKYMSWDWSRGSAPAFEYRSCRRFPGGKVEIWLNVKGGIIQDCKISGDFLGLIALDDLEDSLVGIKYRPADVDLTLRQIKLARYLGKITADEFIHCMFAESFCF